MTFARLLPQGLWLVAVWILLWGEPSLTNLLNGAIIAAVVLTLFWQATPRPASRFKPLAALRYAGHFARSLVVSTTEVAWQVVTNADIRPGVVAVPISGVSDAIVTLVANSVTLTPGTLTVDVESSEDRAVLYVHALDIESPQMIRDEVQYLADLAISAFGHPDTPLSGDPDRPEPIYED